jgi:hypothetical protein
MVTKSGPSPADFEVRLATEEEKNERLRDELAKERTAHTATRSSLHDALDNPIFED